MMIRFVLLSSALFFSAYSMAMPQSAGWIDTHVHYNAEQANVFTAADIISILDQHDIIAALVTSSPAELALQLHQLAPDRIIPFLGLYQSEQDKQTWHQDRGLPARVAQALKDNAWRGVGELHLFAEHRHSSVFRDIVILATQHDLPLLMHADPAVIDRLFEIAPNATVIWAHGGAYPYPPLLGDYLNRYPNLYVDLSMRNERVAPNGILNPEWELLFMDHSDRFMVGIDTFSTSRWERYGEHIEETGLWLNQLPAEIKDRIGYQNVRKLLMPTP
jgi:hypothetical protein